MSMSEDLTFDPSIFAGDTEGERWLVMKFGGTSVATAAHWETIVRLVRERIAVGFRPVVVHSALA